MKKSISIFNEKGMEIPAEYICGEDEKPVVIMAHGLQGSKDEYLDTQKRIAESLEVIGIGSLRIDFRGHGDSKIPLDEFSLASQVDDLSTAVKWLSEIRKNIRIIPMGISFGAPPALILSELYRGITEKCVLIAPVTDYKSTFLYPKTQWGKDIFGYERIVRGICSDALYVEGNYILRKNVLMDMLLADIPSFVKSTDYEICIFHGVCDGLVPISTSEKLSTIRKNIKLVCLEQTEHGLTETGDEDFSSPVTNSNLAKVVTEVANQMVGGESYGKD